MTRRRSLLLATSALALVATTTAVVAPSDAVPEAEARRAVVGAQTVGDSLFPDQGNGGYDATHYDLAITYAAGGSISAVTTIQATTTGEPLSQFSLDLEGLTVSAVTVNGTAATFTRVATAPKFKLVVTPAAPVSGAFTTVITYSGTPVTHTDPDGSKEGWVATPDGAVFVNEPVGAMTLFPHNNTPRDKATYDVRVTVPAVPARKAVGNGVLMPDSTATTWHWQQTKQQASYLTFVGIGLYDEFTSDVALNGGQTTPEWSYQDVLAPSPASSRAQISPILQSIERLYGTYPGVSTGLVVDVSTLGYALETQDRPYFETTIDQDTLIHEYVHQWFGNAVSPTDWSDVWLNEGPAEFVTSQVDHELYGGPTSEDAWYGTWSSTTSDSADWTTPVAGFDDPAALFGWQVYTRGAMVLEALRSALTTPVFTEVMREWIERRSGADGSTADFIALAEEVSGRDLTAFFQDWVFDTDKPAWPGTWDLSTTSAPAAGATVDRGTALTYTLTARNTGKVALADQVATVDVADLLDAGTLGTLPAGVTRDGTTLRWAVPPTALGASSTTSFTVTLADDATPGPLTATTRAATLGATCSACATTLAVAGEVVDPAPTPRITGSTRTDQTLTAAIGTWDPQATLAFQWLRSGKPVDGATGRTYRVRPADVGHRLAIVVAGRREQAAPVLRASAPTAVATRAVQTRRPRPTVTGAAAVGRTLRARPGRRDAGVTLRYQWYVAGRAVGGATGATYAVRPRDEGRRAWVRVTATKPGYVTAVTWSRRTARIAGR